MTELSPYLTYSSVVAHDGICLRFVSHRYWKCAVLNFAHECIRQIVIVVKSLCGLKSTGAAWYIILSSALSDMGFQSSLADTDKCNTEW